MTAMLARIAANPSELDNYTDPGARVIEMCERAKEWLVLATDTDDIERIVELKSQAEAIRVYSIQKQLGKDSELSAQEVVRRAERGIGLAIRKGQESGEIRGRGERSSNGNQYVTGLPVDNKSSIPSPTDFATADELSGNGAGIYHLTDGVTAEQFEAAVEVAKSEKNLSRANLVRKVKRPDRQNAAEAISELAAGGFDTRGIARKLGITEETVYNVAKGYDITINADAITKRTRRLDVDRIVKQIVLDADALRSSAALISTEKHFADLDREQVGEWANSLSESLRALSKFANQLKKESTQS